MEPPETPQSGMRGLLPGSIAVVEMPVGAAANHGLMAEEADCLSPCVADKRRAEFAAGRYCARQAMLKLGDGEVAITMDGERSPIWPGGLVGSITHSGGYAAAAVARRKEFAGVGIDIEAMRPLEPAVVQRITTSTERHWLATARPGVPWPLMLFSAKESLHKLLHPLTGITLGFRDAELQAEGERRFLLRFRLLDRPAVVEGSWTWDDSRVYSSLALPASEASLLAGAEQ